MLQDLGQLVIFLQKYILSLITLILLFIDTFIMVLNLVLSVETSCRRFAVKAHLFSVSHFVFEGPSVTVNIENTS